MHVRSASTFRFTSFLGSAELVNDVQRSLFGQRPRLLGLANPRPEGLAFAAEVADQSSYRLLVQTRPLLRFLNQSFGSGRIVAKEATLAAVHRSIFHHRHRDAVADRFGLIAL